MTSQKLMIYVDPNTWDMIDGLHSTWYIFPKLTILASLSFSFVNETL